MEYRIVISTDKLDFESKVNQMVNLGWQPIGSHKVITSRTIVRGSETYNTNEYSQTMVKGDFIKDEVIHLLKGLKSYGQSITGELNLKCISHYRMGQNEEAHAHLYETLRLWH